MLDYMYYSRNAWLDDQWERAEEIAREELEREPTEEEIMSVFEDLIDPRAEYLERADYEFERAGDR